MIVHNTARLSPWSAFLLSIDQPSFPVYAGAVLLCRPVRQHAFDLARLYQWVEPRLSQLMRARDVVHKRSIGAWYWQQSAEFDLEQHLSEVVSDGPVSAHQFFHMISA